jgi:hypothetical protein
LRYAPLFFLLLSACTSSADVLAPPPDLKPIEPPSQPAVREGVKLAAKEEKLSGSLEISVSRRTDRGLGRYFVCLRETNPPEGRRFTYSVFFDDDVYKGVRMSAITEACEPQQFVPFS